MLTRILLVLRSSASRQRLKRLAQNSGVLVTNEESNLWRGLAQESFDLLVVGAEELPLPVEPVITAIRKLPDRPEVVVLQDRDELEERAALLAAGCLTVVYGGMPDAALQKALAGAIARRRESAASRLSGAERSHRLADFASSSPAMRSLLDLARRVLTSDSSLLIQGETGVGKEWLARAIHNEGPRVAAPFVAVNCAALPESLLESELFGHEKGAFTGATRTRRGYFELAHRGTIFLDEIAEMSPQLQAKLLRVLQEKRIQRLGGEELVPVDVRIMAATNQDLQEAMARKVFRSDLYYRLGVVTLTIPPLRERREDIPPLVDSYLEQFRLQLRNPVHSIREEALAALLDYRWPGNVRELINVMERAVLLCSESAIGLADLPDTIAGRHAAPAVSGSTVADIHLPLEEWVDEPLGAVRQRALEAVERAYLDRLLRRTSGRVGETARLAGIQARSLYAKMRRLGLRKESYRQSPERSP